MNDVLYYSLGMCFTPYYLITFKLKAYLLECCSTVSIHQKQHKYMLIVKSTSLKAASTM